MFWILLTVVVSFIATPILGYVVHRFTHWPQSGFLYRSHMRHHLDLYPATDLVSAAYRDPGKDSFTWVFVAVGSAGAVLQFWILPMWMATIGVIVGAVLGSLYSLLHDAVHVLPNAHGDFRARVAYQLDKHFPRWFSRLRKLHHLHHRNMSRNYGVFLFHLDRWFGTYQEPTHTA